MAKRLTDTEKWKDDWYISLSNDYRIVWQWLIDNCSHAGFCKRSMNLLNTMCRIEATEEEMIKMMDRRVVVIGNEWFIPKFIKFQYPTLMSLKPAILSVVRELYQKNCIGIIPESFGNDYKIISKSFENHCEMIKVKVKDTVKVKVSLEASIQKVSNGDSAKDFSPDGDGVIFEDGSFQAFGQDQKNDYTKGSLRPRDIKKGLSY